MHINNKLKLSCNWLTDELKLEIRKVFEPRYKRKLSDLEIVEIAENLSVVVEEIIKVRWKLKYGK
jgi:hypothetical protein